jgi:hypothetical protein
LVSLFSLSIISIVVFQTCDRRSARVQHALAANRSLFSRLDFSGIICIKPRELYGASVRHGKTHLISVAWTAGTVDHAPAHTGIARSRHPFLAVRATRQPVGAPNATGAPPTAFCRLSGTKEMTAANAHPADYSLSRARLHLLAERDRMGHRLVQLVDVEFALRRGTGSPASCRCWCRPG